MRGAADTCADIVSDAHVDKEAGLSRLLDELGQIAASGEVKHALLELVVVPDVSLRLRRAQSRRG